MSIKRICLDLMGKLFWVKMLEGIALYITALCAKCPIEKECILRGYWEKYLLDTVVKKPELIMSMIQKEFQGCS